MSNTFAEQCRQEGVEIGLQKGQQKEGVRIVSKQLKIKFQDQAEKYHDLLENASTEVLEMIAERILVANQIEEVFDGI